MCRINYNVLLVTPYGMGRLTLSKKTLDTDTKKPTMSFLCIPETAELSTFTLKCTFFTLIYSKIRLS